MSEADRRKSEAIKLKAAGRLPRVRLSDLAVASVPSADAADMHQQERAHLLGRCLHPDTPDRDVAGSDLDDLEEAFRPVYSREECHCICQMHNRMLEATGRGSWPPGKQCHPAKYPHEGYHAALLLINHKQFLANTSLDRDVTDEEWETVVLDARLWPSLERPVSSVAECKRLFSYGSSRALVRMHDRPQWAEHSSKREGEPYNVYDMSTWLVLETARRAGCLYIEVFEGRYNINERMIQMSSGLAGYAYFNNGTCSDSVTSNIQRASRYSLGGITGLRAHELGHTKNLEHEFRSPQSSHRSVMSYSWDNTPYQGYRLSGSPYQYVEDHSWPELRAMFGGDPALPVEVPVPPDAVTVRDGLATVDFADKQVDLDVVIRAQRPRPNQLQTIEIVDAKLDLAYKGEKIQFQLIERADFGR